MSSRREGIGIFICLLNKFLGKRKFLFFFLDKMFSISHPAHFYVLTVIFICGTSFLYLQPSSMSTSKRWHLITYKNRAWMGQHQTHGLFYDYNTVQILWTKNDGNWSFSWNSTRSFSKRNKGHSHGWPHLIANPLQLRHCADRASQTHLWHWYREA